MQSPMIEFFSSLKENGALQDFFANVFMLNLVSFLANPTRVQIHEQGKGCKHSKQINWTAAIGDARTRLVLLFVRGIEKVDSILRPIWESFEANTEAIKPGRMFPSDKRKKGARRKAFMQYKPAQ